MNDIKKVLIAAICVVLAVAIAAGVSIGVLAGTVNGMKDQIAELNQTVGALESQNSAMKAEIEEAAKNNEDLVSAAEFEAKLAEALGTQTQTMQAMISTAVKNQIEELGVEGLTEAQVQTIIDAAVANCLTEDDIDAIVANANAGLSKDEVKKLITDYTAGYLTYGQIVNMIDDADYDLRAYLEKKMATMKQYLEDKISGVQDGLTTEIEIYAEDAINGVYTIDSALVANLVNADYSAVVLCEDDDWSAITVQVDSGLTKSFCVNVTTDVKKVVLGADSVEVYVYENVEIETFVVNAIGTNVWNEGTIGELIAEDCNNDDTDNNTVVYNSAEINKYTDNADGYTATIDGKNPCEWTVVYGTVEYTFTEYGATVTISGEGAVHDSAFWGDSTITTVIVEEGITSIGTSSFKKCPNLTTVVLPEGLTAIGNEAFDQSAKLETINFPSTLETIGEKAFRGVALNSLTLPATVKTLEAGAFRDMPNVETIIIEGNTTIANYAFRSCASLKTVILNGEPTFTGTSQVFCNADNHDGSGITVYVINDEIAAAVLAANGSSKKLTISKPATSENVAEVFASVEDGGVVVLGSGNFVIPNAAQGKTLTVIGTGDTAIATNTSGSYEGCNYALDGSTVVFENITITTDGKTYTGYARCNATYNNCVINNTYTLYGDSVFNNCEFNVSGDSYNIWTWGAPTAEFNNCTFNCDGKAMLLYGTANTKLTINDCVFNDNGTIADKAAIEIGNDYNKSYELIINNIEVNGFDINPEGTSTGTNIWGNKNSMSTDNLNVVIDGKDVY